jgi:hypothetical protein
LKIASKIDKVGKYFPEEIPNTHMENRIDRRDDESLYQPKIHSERIRTLYGLKQATGKPMTVLIDQAIYDLAERYMAERQSGQDPILELVGRETWEDVCEARRLLDQLHCLKCLGELEELKSDGKGRKTY